MNYKSIFLKSTIAGIYISIASYIFIIRNADTVAKFFFSFGLLSCLAMDTPLFTGTVGYIHKPNYFPYNFAVLWGNIYGCLVASVLLPATSNELVLHKLSYNRISSFFLAIVCGIIIYTAVHAFQQKKDNIFVILSVVAFLSIHAEHSIADVAFFCLARYISINSILFIATIIVGNVIGAVLTHYICSHN